MRSISVVCKRLRSDRRAVAAAVVLAATPGALRAQATNEPAKSDSGKVVFQIGPAVSGALSNGVPAIQMAPGQTQEIKLGSGQTMRITTSFGSQGTVPSQGGSVVQVPVDSAELKAFGEDLAAMMMNMRNSNGAMDVKALEALMRRMMRVDSAAVVAPSGNLVEIRPDTSSAAAKP